MPITQAKRPLKVNTPLGTDAIFISSFSAREGISQLFQYYLELIAPNDPDIPFDRLLGQKVTVELATLKDKSRFFNGIVSRFSQGQRDEDFTTYRAEIVPQFWLLTRKWESRIFQHISVPDILKKVLEGITTSFEIVGNFEKRDFCVQYRETDFNFASRLMEEEGIFYYFRHTSDEHKMVLTNNSAGLSDVPDQSSIVFDEIFGGRRPDLRIYSWSKVQEMRAGKYTLFDHCFEQPNSHLDATKTIQDSVQVGTVTHKLKVGGNDKLEIYDYPGEYAQRFDGIDKSGGEQPAEVQKIFQDNQRTVDIRMQQEAVPSIEITGSSNCSQFMSGFTFTLDRHFNANGKYVLTTVMHTARMSNFTSGGVGDFQYSNSFTCIPIALPYRPARSTFRPVVQGTQTAVVVGPSGEEIFTDKYGRVKVQFHWDRDGKNDADSSCWVRVGQNWAGKRWGASFWPRIGQEVIVDFLEGDPDQPIIIGSVYNIDQMPPYLGAGLDPKHKNDNKVSGIKSNTTPGGEGYNEIRFDDNKGKEEVFFHAERNLEMTTKNDSLARTYGNRHQIIGNEKDGSKSGDQREMVYKDKHVKIHHNQIEQIGDSMQLLVGGIDSGQGNQDIVIKGTKKESIAKDDHLHVTGNRNEKIDGGQSLNVGGSQQEKIGMKHAVDVGQEIHIKSGMTVVIEAGLQLTLKVGSNFVDIGPAGVSIQGTMVMINSGGAAGSGTGSSPESAQDPTEASPTEPDVADDSKSGQKSARS
jgi:type VI secretion system secreted protein VgrG